MHSVVQKEPELYSVPSQKSKDKLTAFFGEQSIPIHVGSGSRNKLRNFFVARPSKNSSANAERGLLSPLRAQEEAVGVQKTQSSTSSTDSFVVPSSKAALSRRFSLPGGSNGVPLNPANATTVPFMSPLVNRSTAKIQKVLGSQCPVDVSLQEIEENGLASLLQSRLPLCFFLAYLIENRIPEILFFITDVIEFESRVFDSYERQESAAHMIFQLYLNKLSPLEGNFTYKARTLCARQIKLNANRFCFELPHKEAMVLLEAAYVQFRSSKYYVHMGKIVGNSQIHNQSQERKLRKIISKVLNSSYVLPSSSSGSLEDDSEEAMPGHGYDREKSIGGLVNAGNFLSDSERMKRQTEVVHRNAKLFVSKYGKSKVPIY